MQVEVNEANIDAFNLVERFGNTREFLLSQAADAATKGMVLSVDLPDELVLEQNVFQVYEGEHVDPRRLRGCGYEEREDTDGNKYMVCVMHGKTSRHDVVMDPWAPCIQIDPDTDLIPEGEELEEVLDSMSKTCVYNKREDAINGTTYICAVHGRPSKHDISRLPNLPCLSVDPKVLGENDPHNP